MNRRRGPGQTTGGDHNTEHFDHATGVQRLTQLKRRRQASYRLPPLECCCRDPWPCRCYDDPLSEKQLDAVGEATEHLLALGLAPVFDVGTIRRLWRRDPELAGALARLRGVA